MSSTVQVKYYFYMFAIEAASVIFSPLEEISDALMNILTECHIPHGTTSQWSAKSGDESLGRKRKENM